MATATAPVELETRTVVGKDGKERQFKVKIDYIKEGQPKLKEIPTDFDGTIYNALKAADFESEATFFEYRAHVCTLQAEGYLAKAEEIRLYGSPEKRAAKRKLEAQMKRMKETEALLIEQLGADEVANLLAQLKA